MPLRKLKVAIDTSALTSLGVIREMPRALKYFEFFVPEQVRKELEEISVTRDVHGKSAAYILEFIRAGKIKNVGEINSSESGEEAVVKLARKINADYILMDDIDALHRFKGSGLAIRFSPLVLYLMTKFNEISVEKAKVLLEKMRSKRDWKNNLIYSFAKELLFR